MSTLPSAPVPLQAAVATSVPAAPLASITARHSVLVRVTHWVITLSFFALVVSGAEIVVSHPRFYWGETGNVLTDPWFKLPIPSSRNLVPTGYGFVLPDQNGWSRSLHFQTAWLVVFTGLFYTTFGWRTGHFQRNLSPDFSWPALSQAIANPLRFERPTSSRYNILQQLSYLSVIFI